MLYSVPRQHIKDAIQIFFGGPTEVGNVEHKVGNFTFEIRQC